MSYQRGNRISCPPNALTFWRRYSAYVVSARVNSEVAFCCFAVLIAPRNEASISVSLAPVAVRNTPRSRCNSADHQRTSNFSTNPSASLIASRASNVRFAKYKAPAFNASQTERPEHCTGLPDNLRFPAQATKGLLQVRCPKRCAPSRAPLQQAKTQNCNVLTVQSIPR